MRNWVVAYDISDDRRRLRLANVLEDFGDRVQGSVFELILFGPELETLKARIIDEIEIGEDKVRLYPLCRDCSEKVIDLGVADEIAFDDPEVIII